MISLIQLSFFFLDSPDIARVLIECGADISQIDDNGNTFLHRIVYSIRFRQPYKIVVRELIDHGVNVNAQNNAGDTPLHLVQSWGR